MLFIRLVVLAYQFEPHAVCLASLPIRQENEVMTCARTFNTKDAALNDYSKITISCSYYIPSRVVDVLLH